jgi:hypothetical protein
MQNQNQTITDILWARYSMKKIDKFNLWVQRNPAVYPLFRKFAEQYRAAGYDKCSASLIGNRIRWETAIAITAGEYKLSNDYLPMLARKLATDDASFLSFFSFHGLAGESSEDEAERSVAVY